MSFMLTKFHIAMPFVRDKKQMGNLKRDIRPGDILHRIENAMWGKFSISILDMERICNKDMKHGQSLDLNRSILAKA